MASFYTHAQHPSRPDWLLGEWKLTLKKQQNLYRKAGLNQTILYTGESKLVAADSSVTPQETIRLAVESRWLALPTYSLWTNDNQEVWTLKWFLFPVQNS